LQHLEVTLPDVTASIAVPMVATNACPRELFHPTTQVYIVVWPQRQLEMVCHQAKRE
jgi:hypothetical protein